MPAKSPRIGTSFNQGMPPLLAEAESVISPASPIVWPSCTTTHEFTFRSLKVGELIPGVVMPVATLLTSCITSKVTNPPLFTRGVTSMITPVCW